MEKILAIRGDIFDSNRVIKILESLGGYNRHNISCAYYDYFYYIDSNGDITCIAQDKMLITKFNTHTIGSFLEMYPYNIGDNVILTSKIPVKITNIYDGWHIGEAEHFDFDKDPVEPAWSLHRLIEILDIWYLELNFNEFNNAYDQVISYFEERVKGGFINKKYLEE